MAEEERYPNNSHRYTRAQLGERREERPRKDASAVGKGREKEKSFREILTDSFLNFDPRAIKRDIIYNWLIPGSKHLAEFVVHKILFPNEPYTRYNTPVRDEVRTTRLSSGYGGRYESRRIEEQSTPQRRRPTEPVIEYRSEAVALNVLAELRKCLSDYGTVREKDLYLASDMETDLTMQDRYWDNLDGVKPEQASNGMWVLKFPPLKERRGK